MNCKFTWYNLPNQIKEKIKPFESQLSKEAKNITWYNMPYKLIILYNELALIKPSCKKQVNFNWFTLNEKANLICKLIDCILTVNIIIANPNTFSTKVGTLTIIGNVLSNDTLSGLPATFFNVIVTPLSSASTGIQNPYININGDVYLNKTPKGIYTLNYTICEIASPTNCSTTSVILTVV